MYMDDIYTYTNAMQRPGANNVRFNSPSGLPGFNSDIGSRYESELLTRFIAPVSYEQAHNRDTSNTAAGNEMANMPSSRYANQVRNESLSSEIDSHNIGEKNEMKYMFAGSVNNSYPVPVGNVYANNYVSPRKEDIGTCVPRNFATTSPTRKDFKCGGPNIGTNDFMNKLELERATVHSRFASPATGETVVSPVRTELSANHEAIENDVAHVKYTGGSQSAERGNSVQIDIESKAINFAEVQERKSETFAEHVMEGKIDDFKIEDSTAAKISCDMKHEEFRKSDPGKDKIRAKFEACENADKNPDFEVEVLTDDADMNSEESTAKKTRIIVKITKTATKQTNPDTLTSDRSVEKCQMSGCHDSLAQQENPDALTSDITKKKCYKCENCDKIYKRRDHLSRHMQTAHSELRPFLCRVCSHTFSRKDRLIRHEKIHSGAPQFSCNTCEKHFFRRDSLTKHLRSCKKSIDDSKLTCV